MTDQGDYIIDIHTRFHKYPQNYTTLFNYTTENVTTRFI